MVEITLQKWEKWLEKRRKGTHPSQRRDWERHIAITRAAIGGETLRPLGQRYNISGCRAGQIVTETMYELIRRGIITKPSPKQYSESISVWNLRDKRDYWLGYIDLLEKKIKEEGK